jgi:hypothetical protein
MYSERFLRCHFRYKLSLGLALSGKIICEHAAFIDKTIIRCRLQWSSRSCRDYMHAYSIHTILLPEHAQTRELVIHVPIHFLPANDWLRRSRKYCGSSCSRIVDCVIEPINVTCNRSSKLSVSSD